MDTAHMNELNVVTAQKIQVASSDPKDYIKTAPGTICQTEPPLVFHPALESH